jgi:hypothetical protein
MKESDIAVKLIDKRIKILNKILGKEVKAIKKNPTFSRYIANELKSKIYELAYLREEINKAIKS